MESNFDIEVLAEPKFVPGKSNLDKNSYVYAYTVSIKNNSDQVVQLLNRHWRIYSAGIQIADVKGEGVIGEKPVLNPGQEYSYSSWTVVRDIVGEMKGQYTFYREDGKFLDVSVPAFQLLYIDESRVH